MIKTDRFLDSPPKSLNEAPASFMRRINICEERESGVDKVIIETESWQLPALFSEQRKSIPCLFFLLVKVKRNREVRTNLSLLYVRITPIRLK